MLNSLNVAAFKKLQEKIDARIVRERVLIFLSAIALVFMLWNIIIQAPFDKKMQATQTQLIDLAAQSATTQTQITTATQALLNDPQRLKKAQITQLKSDISNIEVQLQNTSQRLIKADQLPQVLQDVLQKTSQLTLLEVATLPLRELQFASVNGFVEVSDDKRNRESNEALSMGVYEHVVELRVAGNYFQVVHFLTALEALPWRFYWQRLDYSVTRYPNAEIIIRVYTLSSEEGLLGV